MKTAAYARILDQIERQFRFHGIWLSPETEWPKLRIPHSWKPPSAELARLLSRIFLTRSIPEVTRLYGPISDETAEEFLHDCSCDEEREEILRREMKRLLADLEVLPQFDSSIIDADLLEEM